jgi:hypothetical protein
MAIRYSGDAEVRVLWNPTRRVFVGSVRDPYVRWRGTAPRPSQVKGRRLLHRASESYDLMAALFLRRAQLWAKEQLGHVLQLEEKHGRIQIRRVFQAPCPTETCAKRRGRGR